MSGLTWQQLVPDDLQAVPYRLRDSCRRRRRRGSGVVVAMQQVAIRLSSVINKVCAPPGSREGLTGGRSRPSLASSTVWIILVTCDAIRGQHDAPSSSWSYSRVEPQIIRADLAS